MATKTFTARPLNPQPRTIYSVTMAQNDTCSPLDVSSFGGERSIQVSGTFGGATIGLGGSNEVIGAHPVALHDIDGTTIAITSANLLVVKECTGFLTPTISGGDGTTSLLISILAG